MISHKAKALMFIAFGLTAVIALGTELGGLIQREQVELSSYRFGTLSGLTAIGFIAANFIIGLAFVIWGIVLIKGKRMLHITNRSTPDAQKTRAR